MRVVLLALALSGSLLLAADTDLQERGRHEEQRACVQCHSLRIIESQRLSPAAWGKEIDKMAGWGAVISDRQLLLDFLSQEYSDSKPIPHPELSGDGVTHRSGSDKTR
jgi:hypothetical protein